MNMKQRLKRCRWILVVACLVLLQFATMSVHVANAEEATSLYEKLGPSNHFKDLMPSRDEARVAVFLVEFQDEKHEEAHTPEYWENLYFGDRDSLRSYYRDASYEKLNITGDVYGWYTLEHERAYYETGNTREMLLREVVENYDDEIDFSQYDGDADGHVDGIYVVFAGATGKWNSTWWPSVGGVLDNELADGMLMASVALIADSSDYMTVCHETGHMMGLRDYYDAILGSDDGYGGSTLMNENKGDLDALSKILLGWVSPTVIVDDTEVSLASVSTEAEIAVIYPKNDTDSDEFFLVEYVTKEKHNIYAEAGLQVYRVNAKQNADGSFVYRVAKNDPKLIEVIASGLLEGEEITPYVAPSSYLVKEVNGEVVWLPTGISITDIEQQADGTISFSVVYADEIEPKESEYQTVVQIANNSLYLKVAFSTEMRMEGEEVTVYATAGETQVPLVLKRDLLSHKKTNKNEFYLYSEKNICQPETEYVVTIPAGMLVSAYGVENREIKISVTTCDYPEAENEKIGGEQEEVNCVSGKKIPIEDGKYVYFIMKDCDLYMRTADIAGTQDEVFLASLNECEEALAKNIDACRLENGQYVVVVSADSIPSVLRIQEDGSARMVKGFETFSHVSLAGAVGNDVLVLYAESEEGTITLLKEDDNLLVKDYSDTYGKFLLRKIFLQENGSVALVIDNEKVVVLNGELNAVPGMLQGEDGVVRSALMYGEWHVVVRSEAMQGQDVLTAYFYDEEGTLVLGKKLLHRAVNGKETDVAGLYQVGNGFAAVVTHDKSIYNTNTTGNFAGLNGIIISEIVFLDEAWNEISSYTIKVNEKVDICTVDSVIGLSDGSCIASIKEHVVKLTDLDFSSTETLQLYRMSEASIELRYEEEKTLNVFDAVGGLVDNSMVKWSSFDEKIVTVEEGRLTVTGNGSTVVYATVDGITVQCVVNTSNYPGKLEGLSFSSSGAQNEELVFDETWTPSFEKQLHVWKMPYDAIDAIDAVVWDVADEGVVLIEANIMQGAPWCKVFPVGNGTTEITARLGNFVASCTVTVKNYEQVEYSEFRLLGQSDDKIAESGGNAVLSVSAVGTGISYQWQYSGFGTNEWADVENANKACLNVSAGEETVGRYRCVITDATGQKVFSKVMRLVLLGNEDISSVIIDETNFPDTAFRKYVQENFDTDRNGVLSDAEIEMITCVWVSYMDVTSIKGIEHFYNLSSLQCIGNRLVGLDVGKNTLLDSLGAEYNRRTICKYTKLSTLESFDVTKATNWQGATYDAGTDMLLVEGLDNFVTYDYDCGNGFMVTFSLDVVGHIDIDVDGFCDVCEQEANPILMQGTLCDNFTWGRTEDYSTLYIYGTGEMYNFNDDFDRVPWAEERGRIQKIIVEGDVTSIGDYVFTDCYNVTSVTLPDTVTRIGNYAFDRCRSLTEFDFSGIVSVGTKAFQETALIEVVISKEIQQLGVQAFAGCQNITSFSVEDGSLSDYYTDAYGALLDSENKSLLAYPKAAEYIESYTVPEEIESIESGVFSCNNVGTVIFPASMKKINDGIAWGNYFTTLTIPDTVERIGQGAFAGSAKLTTVTIPGSVECVEQGAFQNCPELVEIIVEDGVEWLHDYAFADNAVLEAVTIPPSVTTISQFLFHNTNSEVKIKGYTNSPAEVYANMYGYTFESIGIVEAEVVASGNCGTEGNEESVTWAFYNDGVLKISGTGAMKDYETVWSGMGAPWLDDAYRMKIVKVIIEEGVTHIGKYAFDYSESLLDVEIADTVTSIGARAFKDTRWANPVVPKNVTEIGSGAFHIPAEFLNSLSVEEGNEYFVIFEGGLYDADKTILLKWGLGDAYEDGEYRVVLPETVKTIGIDAFCGSIVAAVTLPEGLETLEERAFYNAHNITELHIPSTVTSIAEDALLIDNLTHFTVGEGNTTYSADDRGALFNADKTVLYNYPAANKERFYAIPDGVKTVKRNALRFEYLEGLLIPASVENMESGEIELGNPNSLDNRHMLLYGYTGSYAETYATVNQYKTWDEHWNEQRYDHVFLEIPTEEYKRLTIACPVDVYVYDAAGNVVASVVDEQVLVYDETIYADEMEKTVYLPNSDDYRVEIIATGDGKVSYTMEEITTGSKGDEVTNVVEFKDIAIKAEDTLSTEITMMTGSETGDYVITKNDGEEDIVSDKVTMGELNSTPSDPVGAFVDRIYTTMLERNPDANRQDWIDKLTSGTYTGAQIIDEFFGSQEFMEKNAAMSDEAFVTIMYRTMFDRDPDAGGLADWTGKLSEGYVRRFVMAGVVNSDEFKSLCNRFGIYAGEMSLTMAECTPGLSEQEFAVWQFVERLYVEVLGRTPDPTGMADWSDKLFHGGWTGTQVAVDGFLVSPEFMARAENMTNEAFVQTMYRVFFDRDGDATGMTTWQEKLAEGYSRRYIYGGFTNSGEFQNVCDKYGITRGELALTMADNTPNLTTQEISIWNFVERLYMEVLGRPADRAGMADWSGKLLNGTMTGAQAAEGVIMSQEFLGRSENLTNEEYVLIMYKAFFNRIPEATESINWVNALNNNLETRRGVFASFANAQEFANLCAAYGITQGSVTE